MYNILICDDEQDIVNALKIYLANPDYHLLEAHTGQEALDALERKDIHLVLLDIMMPEMDGITALAKLRQVSNVPVILLTAKSEDTDKILGLNIGADDYITKPFAIEELLARIRVALKKSKAAGGKEEHRIEVNQVILDDDRHEVSCHGERIELTHREYELLKVLMQNKNIVMDREKLLNLVCGYDYAGETNIIDVYIRYIRAKVDDRFGIKLITTVRSVGYVIKEGE